MELIDVSNLKDSIMPVTIWQFTLDGKRISSLQNFKITASLDGDLLVDFDGERFETFKQDDGRTRVKVKEDGAEGKYGIIEYYSLAERAAKENNSRIIVKNITMDEKGFPTFNLITIEKEKE